MPIVSFGPGMGVIVGVPVGEGVIVEVGVLVGVLVAVKVLVGVYVAVGVLVGVEVGLVIVMVYCMPPQNPLASWAVTVKVNVPAVVGVPDKAPPVLNVIPGGKLPLLTA